MGIHDGHRARMKLQMMEHGLDTMNDHEVLELLLYYAIPRRDTNELAHRLLEHFGSLAGVFEASPRDLQSVPGVGQHAACLLHLIPQVNRRYLISRETRSCGCILSTAADVRDYVQAHLLYERNEVVYAVCLDSSFRVINCRKLSQGTVNAVDISIRMLIEHVLNCNAVSLLLAHNHPDAPAFPSEADIETTVRIRTALENIGVYLLDHVIIGSDGYLSFSESGLL